MSSVICIKNILGNSLLSRSHHGIVTASNYYCRSISSCRIIKGNSMHKLLGQSRYHHHICNNNNKNNYNDHRMLMMMRFMKNRRSLANVTSRSHETPPMPPDVKRSAVRSAILVSILSSLMAWAILREPDEDDKMDYKAMEDTFRKQNQQINSMQHHQPATSVDSASSNTPPSHNK